MTVSSVEWDLHQLTERNGYATCLRCHLTVLASLPFDPRRLCTSQQGVPNQGHLHHINDGANAPWKKQGEVSAGT